MVCNSTGGRDLKLWPQWSAKGQSGQRAIGTGKPPLLILRPPVWAVPKMGGERVAANINLPKKFTSVPNRFLGKNGLTQICLNFVSNHLVEQLQTSCFGGPSP